MRRVLALSLLGLGLSATVGAQEPWKTSYYPYLFADPTNGVMLVAHFHRGQAADYFDRVPFDGVFSAEGAIGARGSRFLTAGFKAPRLSSPWRFGVQAGAVREAWYGFSAQGGAVPPDASAEGPDLTERVHRTRYYLRGEVSRPISGPLLVSLGGSLQRARFTRVPEESAFRDAYGDELTETDAMGRIALILDTRDKEFVPTRGVFLEVGAYAGTGGDDGSTSGTGGGYQGAYGVARGFVPLQEGTVMAARMGFRTLSTHPTLDAQYTIPAWERPIEVLGGVDSHRSFIRGRFRGRGALMSALEIRQDFLNAGDYGAIVLLGFVEAGRVFQDDFRFTTKGWEVGGGGGIMLRILRSTLLGFNFAGGPDGFLFSMSTGWGL